MIYSSLAFTSIACLSECRVKEAKQVVENLETKLKNVYKIDFYEKDTGAKMNDKKAEKEREYLYETIDSRRHIGR